MLFVHSFEYFKYIEYHGINLLVILFIILCRFMIYKKKTQRRFEKKYKFRYKKINSKR